MLRLRQLAASAQAAADAEDSVDTGVENDAPARDPASLQRVELVQVTSQEIEKATPQLISAAEVSAFDVSVRVSYGVRPCCSTRSLDSTDRISSIKLPAPNTVS